MKFLHEYHDEIEEMNIFQKAKVWTHYMTTELYLKHRLQIFIDFLCMDSTGLFGGKIRIYKKDEKLKFLLPNKTEIFYPGIHRKNPVIPFHDWIDPEKNTKYTGIWGWWPKFSDEIKL